MWPRQRGDSKAWCVAGVYVRDLHCPDIALEVLGRYIPDARPGATRFAVNSLASASQLIEIKLDSIDGAKDIEWFNLNEE